MLSRERFSKLVGLAVLLVSPLSFAQTYREYSEPGVRRGYGPPSGSGSTVTVGGGVNAFSGASARSMTEGGGAWGLRLGWGTRTLLGMEAAYLGSLNRISAPGLDPNAYLLGSGAEANLRLNLPVAYRDSLIEPFGLAGLGWTHFNLVNDDVNASNVAEKDDIMTVPLGAGLALAHRGFLVDARFTYRMAYRENLIGSTDLSSWAMTANLGSEF